MSGGDTDKFKINKELYIMNIYSRQKFMRFRRILSHILRSKYLNIYIYIYIHVQR